MMYIMIGHSTVVDVLLGDEQVFGEWVYDMIYISALRTGAKGCVACNEWHTQ